MLGQLGNAVAQALHDIVLGCWRSEKAPAEFTRDLLIPIPKKAGAADCKDFRTLALQPVAAKVYALILRDRLSQWLQGRLLEPQCGFRPGRGYADALFCLRSVCSSAWNKDKTLYICMLDLTKAFDSADRDLAWHILLT